MNSQIQKINAETWRIIEREAQAGRISEKELRDIAASYDSLARIAADKRKTYERLRTDTPKLRKSFTQALDLAKDQVEV